MYRVPSVPVRAIVLRSEDQPHRALLNPLPVYRAVHLRQLLVLICLLS